MTQTKLQQALNVRKEINDYIYKKKQEFEELNLAYMWVDCVVAGLLPTTAMMVAKFEDENNREISITNFGKMVREMKKIEDIHKEKEQVQDV